MPIRTPDGYLDITNATLRGSEIITTSNVGIANSAPTHTLSVGNKLFVDDSAANVLTVSGNLVATSLKIGQIDLAPSYGLEHVANVGNTISSVVQFTNTGTGFVSASNVGIGTTTTPAGLLDVVGSFRMRFQDMGVTKAHIITGGNSASISESGGVYTYTRGGSGNTGNFLPNPSNIVPKVGQRYRVKLTARSDYAGTIRYECPTSTIITTYDLTASFKEYTWDFTATGTTMQFAVTTASGTTSQFNAFSIERLGVGFNVNPTSTTAPIQFSGVTHFSDNVGIGTNNPIGKLDVRGAIIAPVIPFSSNQDAPYLVAGTPGYTGDPGNTGNWNLHGFEHRIKVNGSGVPRITVDDGYGNEVFTVVNGGNVGIGTNNPGELLTLYGASHLKAHIESSGAGTAAMLLKNTNGQWTIGNHATTADLELSSSAGTKVWVKQAGNVGIGTASPGEKLHVHENLSTSGHQIAARIGGTASSTYSTLVFGSKEGRPHIGGHKGDYGAWHDLSLQNDLMILKQSNMRVGIGTTTPDAPLHIFKAGGNAGDVGGGIKMERWDNYGCAIWSQYPSGGTVDCMAFRVANNATDAYGGTPQMVLTHEGRIGIGTTDPSSKFHVNGRIRSDQPRFFAYDTRSATNFSGGDTLALNTTHYNSGSHYSTSTGYFTAPVNGVYYFHVSFFTYTTMQFAWKLVPTAGSTSYNNMRVTRNNNTGGDDVLIQTTSVSGQFSGSISLYLSTNEKFGWGSRNQSGSFYGRHSHFSGYLLSEV